MSDVTVYTTAQKALTVFDQEQWTKKEVLEKLLSQPFNGRITRVKMISQFHLVDVDFTDKSKVMANIANDKVRLIERHT